MVFELLWIPRIAPGRLPAQDAPPREIPVPGFGSRVV